MKYYEFQEKYPILKAKAQELYFSYKDQYENLLNYVAQKTAHKEYARGGLGFGLGYYWANPMQDRVIGGMHRGHLLKRVNAAKEPDWEYFFNQSNTLIAAQENLSNNTIMHFLLHDIDEYVWELIFNDDARFERISVTFNRGNHIDFELVFSLHSFSGIESFQETARYDAWIFEYQDQDIIEFEHFWDFLYPEKVKEFLLRFNLSNQLIRKIYKKHEESTESSLQYDLYERNEETGECRFVMTQSLL